MATLKQRAENAKLRMEIARDNANAKYLQYVNDNLAITRKRKQGWTTPADAERDFDSSDRRKAMAQARQLIDEDPLALGMLRSHLSYTVGNEFRLSMRSGDSGWDAAVESWWDHKKDALDIRGYRTWGRLLWLWQARRMIDGDVGVVLVSDNDADTTDPQAWVQTIEADRIFKADPDDAKDVGIDFDPYGMPDTFFVGKRDHKKGDKTTPYNRSNFHFFAYQPGERAEQARGMSAFLCLINLLKDMAETEEGMALKVKKESFLGLKFKSASPDQNPFGAVVAGSIGTEGGETRPHVSLVPGLNLNLDIGEDAELMESKSPPGSYEWWIRWRLRKAGMPWGLPLEYILLDSSEVNYSGLMTLAQMLRRVIKVHQGELKVLASRIFKWALSYEGIPVIGEPPKAVKATSSAHNWGCPTGGFIDPEKEANAYQTLLDAKLTTRNKILSEIGDGDDVDDLVKQLEKENGMFKDAGLESSADSTKKESNPATAEYYDTNT